MNIAFRVDSSEKMGFGHLSRCLTLSKQLKKKNKIYFFSKNLKGNRNHLIKKNKLNLEIIDSFSDAENTIKYIKKFKIDYIFVDNYNLDFKWEKNISRYCKIVLIDDYLQRKSFCDIYINYHYQKNYNLKNKLKNNCKKLLGPQYLIVKKEKKKIIKQKNKIFIFISTVDSKNIAEKVLKILVELKFFYIIYVVLSDNNKKNLIIKKFSNNKNIKFLNFNEKNFHKYSKDAKIILSGTGVSMYENLIYNDNNIFFINNLIQNKITKDFKIFSDALYLPRSGPFKNKILAYIKKKDKKKNFVNLIDNLGVSRIENYLNNPKKNNYFITKAKVNDFFFFQKFERKDLLKSYLNFKNLLKSKNKKVYVFKNLHNFIGIIKIRYENKKIKSYKFFISSEYLNFQTAYFLIKKFKDKFSNK
jgi:UDP-2,4-diacetamido-2,4,6-trideoxy-beta-L-altropyranose hydrolase